MNNQWIKIDWSKPSTLPCSGRVEAFTPSDDLVMRHRFFDSQLFKQAATDATHWRYVSEPTASNVIPLHSFDEEPETDTSIYLVFDDHLFFSYKNENVYYSADISRSWTDLKSLQAKGWLYESELMLCVKNGTRSG